MVDIAAVIDATNLEPFDIYEGDCANIALALQRRYGGQLVASYADNLDFKEKQPAHIAVRIDGTLYDGGGVTSDENLRERAYYGVSNQGWDEIVITEIQRPSPDLHDPDQVDEIATRFQTAEKTVSSNAS